MVVLRAGLATISRATVSSGAKLASHAALWFTLSLALAVGCGGGTYRGGEYHDEEAAYRLGAPAGDWTRVNVENQNDLAWHSDSLNAVIQGNGSCDPALDIPLVALTNHLLIGFTERDVVSQELVPMSSREALRTHVRAKLDGVTRELLLQVLKKDRCVYDFALVAPPGADFQRASETFTSMLQGFEARGVEGR